MAALGRNQNNSFVGIKISVLYVPAVGRILRPTGAWGCSGWVEVIDLNAVFR
jgi:hypothetical protein